MLVLPKYLNYDEMAREIFVLKSSAALFDLAYKKLSTPYADGTPRLVTSIDEAIGYCVANRADHVKALPGHTETPTVAITLDVAGVTVSGTGNGTNKPALNTATAIDVVTITAADCTFEGFDFAVPGIDAVTADINIAAANVTVRNTRHLGSTTDMNKVDIITLAAGCHDAVVDGVKIWNDTVECVGGIVLEGISKRVEVKNCFVFDSIGFTGGSISDEATSLGVYIHHNVFANAKADTVVAEFGNNTTGTFAYNCIAGRHSTIASNITTGTGMNFFENYTVEQVSLNGMLNPAADSE